jgi:PBP1b-binding outer membrane lipoprotein LpoB
MKRLLIILFVAVVLAGCTEWDKMFEPVQSVMSSPVQPTPRPTPVWAEWFLSQ